MSKSKAQKIREKRIQAGRRDPQLNRSPFALLDMATRKTKTKKDYLYRTKHKNRYSRSKEKRFFFVS